MGADAQFMTWFGFRRSRQDDVVEDVLDEILAPLVEKFPNLLPGGDADNYCFLVWEDEEGGFKVGSERSDHEGDPILSIWPIHIDCMASSQEVGWGISLGNCYWWQNPTSLTDFFNAATRQLIPIEDPFRRFLEQNLPPEVWAKAEPLLDVWGIPNYD